MVEIIVALITVLGVLAIFWLLHFYPPEIRLRKDFYTFDGAQTQKIAWLQEQNERQAKLKAKPE